MTTTTEDIPISSLSLNQKSNAFSTVEFGVEIPSELISLTNPNLAQCGVVGTITILKNSAMVWIGWGSLEDTDANVDSNNIENSSTTSGSVRISGSGTPRMGPSTVAMPRTKYGGMSSGGEAPCSQLIGGDNEEEVMMGNNMASRLSKKVGWPIFVSCSLGDMGNLRTGGSGMEELDGNAFGDLGSLAVHGAALAEKEVGRIILQKKAEIGK
jgi:hypothetical protein